MVRSAAKNHDGRRGGRSIRADYARVLAELTARRRRVGDDDALRARGEGVRRTPRTTTARSRTTCPSLDADGGARRAVPGAVLNAAASSSCRTCATARTRTSSAAFYRDLHPAPGSLVDCRAAAGQGALVQQHRRRRCGLGMRQELRPTPACVIVKHANPCGVAVGATAAEAYAQGVQDRSDLGLRRHHRLQPRRSTRRRPQARRASSSSRC